MIDTLESLCEFQSFLKFQSFLVVVFLLLTLHIYQCINRVVEWGGGGGGSDAVSLFCDSADHHLFF